MLHCWQPKRKYNLNGCQTVKSRKKKLCVRIYSPRKEKATAACSGGLGRGWPGPRLPSPGADIGRTERKAIFRLSTALGGSWKGIWVFLRAL